MSQLSTRVAQWPPYAATRAAIRRGTAGDRDALAEDLGPDFLDVTSVATIPADQPTPADLVARADGVVAGLAVAAAVFELVGR